MYAKPREMIPEFFTFLKPLDLSVWLHMYTVMLCVALALYVVSKYVNIKSIRLNLLFEKFHLLQNKS